MRSYLSLIPISAKVRKRQNRMTILCVIISVMLVTTIFGMSDMMIRRESEELHRKHGNWHIKLEDISPEIAEEISQRADVTGVGWSEVFNSDAEQPYYIGEKKAALYGSDNIYLTKLSNALEEGSYPQNDHEVMLSSNAKLALDVQTGDSVTIQTPAGNVDFTVSGFGSDDRDYYQGQTYMAAVYMTRAAFTSIMEQNGVTPEPVCYVQFQDASKVLDAVAEIMQQYGLPDGSVSENTAVMGIAGRSSNKSMINVYGIAAVLFILVLLAGVLMISGSMNSNVAQRMKFFGMMRCIGASREQIIRYVRLEALNWCKTAVPFGLLFGTGASVGICAVLHYGIGGEWENMPVFAVSPIGLLSGAVVGIVTVLLAAQAPAKRAAKVSPMAAVSGNMEMAPPAGRTVRVSASKSLSGISKKSPTAGCGIRSGSGKVETMLGVHHATASKKNWFLMTASFSSVSFYS